MKREKKKKDKIKTHFPHFCFLFANKDFILALIFEFK